MPIAANDPDNENPTKIGGVYKATPETFDDGDKTNILTDANGRLVLSAGGVASGATDSGNPMKIGGVFVTTRPTFVSGQRADAQMSSGGSLAVELTGPPTAGADAVSNANLIAVSNAGGGAIHTGYGPLQVANFLFNGTTWDRPRGNVDTTVGITASGVTTTQTGTDQTNYNGRGVKVVLDMTTVGTGSVTITIQGKDTTSGKYYTLLAGAAVVTNSTNVYEVYPGAPATANVSANATLPRTWRVLVTANNANATTYTVGASVIV